MAVVNHGFSNSLLFPHRHHDSGDNWRTPARYPRHEFDFNRHAGVGFCHQIRGDRGSL
ncbi:MAG UNVERIFIED_CONTAM: hypothetical protein LVR29_04275 [Microcystis novacekii LVE1205-3]